MERVVVTKPMVGICGMQVCAAKDASDEEILATCNAENPAGTTNGWGRVHRAVEDGSLFCVESNLPVRCSDDAERMHFLVFC